jgi:3-hydroxyisobutyrate dehydrogenase-like beta-hydroxyacid dehydrogenase
MKILFVGIGEMGVWMAENILKKNGALDIWNRTKDKPHVLNLLSQGAVMAPDFTEAVSKADFICFNLTSDVAAKAVLPEVKAGLKEGTVLMDFSTISPNTAAELAGHYLEKKSFYLDSPVSGGSAGAKAGTLAIMAGGDEAAFKKAMPVFEMCGNNIQHMGASGAGQKAKLINQHLTWINQAVVCEAMLLARKVGINLESLNKVLLTSWGRSWMLERSVARFIIPMNFESPSGVELMVKDYNLLLEMAQEVGCELPIANVAKRPYDQAMAEGLAKKDPSVVIEIMEKYNIKN